MGLNRGLIVSLLGGAVMKYGIILLFLLCATSIAENPYAQSENTLKRTIRLRGLPNDEVPVITALALQPSGNLLASAGDDHKVRLWDIESGQLQYTLTDHHDWVTSLAFCEGGTMLLTGGRDRQVLAWNASNGSKPTRLGKHDKPISSICLLYTSPSPRDLSTSRMPSSA